MAWKTLEERFWEKVDKNGPGGCWLWLSSISPAGYGTFFYKKRCLKAHRIAYTLCKGEIPNHLQLDHLCRVRHCVNPDHLEPVSHKENILRGVSPAAKNLKKTHCLAGHEYDEKNTYYHKSGRRNCRQCSRERYAKHIKISENRPVDAPFGLRTHCSNGHEFTKENTYRPKSGGRKCRACGRDRARLK